MAIILTTTEKIKKLINDEVKKTLSKENIDYERDLLLKQTSLEVLQSQINPHFLYNTLECIRGKALIEHQNEIADISFSLSQFFRYSISGKENVVAFSDELENIKCYIHIQNYRFNNRFKVIYDIDDDVMNAKILKLSLQPLVENSIIHGLANMVEGGQIEIKAKRTKDNMRIIISDNGCGMSVEQLEVFTDKINGKDADNGNQKPSRTGIGIVNVNKRIKLQFGQEYGINVHSVENIGTDVEMCIPYIQITND